LLAYVEVLREDAIDEFRLRKLAWMIAGNPKHPPEPPPILK
jgi:hypothetical protein